MAVLGWVIITVMWLLFTFGGAIAAVCCIQPYNIGGTPYTWKDRLWIPVWLVLDYLIFTLLVVGHAPFTITIN